MNEREAAPLAGMSVSRLQKLRVYGGGPPFLKIGRAVRYRREDVEEWVAGRVVYSTSQRVRD